MPYNARNLYDPAASQTVGPPSSGQNPRPAHLEETRTSGVETANGGLDPQRNKTSSTIAALPGNLPSRCLLRGQGTRKVVPDGCCSLSPHSLSRTAVIHAGYGIGVTDGDSRCARHDLVHLDLCWHWRELNRLRPLDRLDGPGRSPASRDAGDFARFHSMNMQLIFGTLLSRAPFLYE
jgi:hypothetical protein